MVGLEATVLVVEAVGLMWTRPQLLEFQLGEQLFGTVFLFKKIGGILDQILYCSADFVFWNIFCIFERNLTRRHL